MNKHILRIILPNRTVYLKLGMPRLAEQYCNRPVKLDYTPYEDSVFHPIAGEMYKLII